MKMNGSYYKRKYSYSNKKNYAILILFITLFFGVGYAYLNTLLTINGTATVHKNAWDVHFENIVKVDGSIEASSEATITDDTAVDFTVDLLLPGDIYSFTVDVVNDGTIDAMLSEVLKTGLTTEQEAYIEYTVTYSDGEEIIAKDALSSGKQDQLLVSVKYKDDIEADDLPSENQSIVLNLSTDYVQDDGTSTDRRLPKQLLYDMIVAQNQENGLMVLDNQASTYVGASTGIDFNVNPGETNGQGVYVRNGTESDAYPIYYYRGEVTNNNVIFGGYCWKIVRTTETGGIKLIYNGVPTDGTCNNTGAASQIGESEFNFNDESIYYNAHIGYMYGTPNSSTYEAEHLSTKESTSSTIKTYIDTWYSQNMTSYTGYLEDTVWCNDRSIITAYDVTGTGTGTSETYYGAYGRVGEGAGSNLQPSLECTNQNDRFTVNEAMEGRANGNGALTHPVALLTADELVLAGSMYGELDGSGYLITNNFWWTMSPDIYYSGFAGELYMLDSGLMYGESVGLTALGVRPAVSLKIGTEVFEGGDGSATNPFVVDAGEKTITIEANDDIVSNVAWNRALPGIKISLLSKSGRSSINSFKMNGELIEGNSFIMPEENVIITDVDVTEPTNSLYEILVNRNKEMDGVMVLDNQASTYVSANTGIDFNVAPSDTNGKGVYVRNGTESDTYPIYYYRGEVTNNNVLFANYCWKIVRTTETGGIKLIYNGTPKDYFETTPIESSEYTNVKNDATYAYTYDSTTKNWTSTNKTDGATGTITFSVATAGYYAINYVVSSEESWDYAYFYLDGVELGVYSGETSGSISLGEITPSNVITVKYTKDDSEDSASGSDTVSFNVGLKIGDITKSCDNTGEASQIGTSAFNSNYNYNAYVGYMYGTPNSSTYEAEHANTNNSTIKTAIDEWYSENMRSYTSYLEDTVWCNDRSFASSNTGTGAGKSETYYGAYERNISKRAPSLECVNQNDRFTVNETMEGRVNGNAALTYPVALLTTDEAMLAGQGWNRYSRFDYLTTGQDWWSMSPYGSSGASVFFVASSGALGVSLVEFLHGVRPSVSLLLGTEIESGGDGSVNSPFVVVTE